MLKLNVKTEDTR